MKRYFLTLLIITCVFVAHTSFAWTRMMSVQVRKGELRSSPSFLANVVKTVNYGDRLQVLETKGAWTKVTFANQKDSGWIHTSALTKKRVKLQAGSKDADIAASSGELALAGKGFNSDVEAQFKSKNKGIDFSWIDKMEKMKVSVKDLKAFLKNGGIEAPKGGAQ